MAIEFVWIWQAIRYGRKEVCRWLSQRDYTLVILGAIVTAGFAWAVLKQHLNDPLYLVSMYLTVAYYPAASMVMIKRRKFRAGQSLLLWMFPCPSRSARLGSHSMLGPGFHTAQFIGYIVMVTISALAVIYVWLRLPEATAIEGPQHS